ncbi:MAG: hypothetical protein VX501_07390 [Pseudomonadota bacterium]|nr:hypothetical protein [Pseudomonadota bacterium]
MLRSLTLLASVFALAACSTPGPDHPRADRARGGPAGGAAGPASGFTLAARLVDGGQYQPALPILRCVADQGHGYEIAQYLAGYSLLRLANEPNTPEILRPEHRAEGFERLESAARAGWGAAQAELAQVYWEVGSNEAVERGLYWASVYTRNTRDRAYGIDRIPDALEAQLEQAVTRDTHARLQTEATRFVIEPLHARALTPECTRLVQERRTRGAGGQRGQGRAGRGGGRGPGGGRGNGGQMPGVGTDVD